MTAADRNAAETAHPPEILELPGGQFAEIDAPVVAGIEDNEIGRLIPTAWRHRMIEEMERRGSK